MPRKFVPLSQYIFAGVPLRAEKRLKAIMAESVDRLDASSKWTSRVDRQVNKATHRGPFSGPK